jgi:hypothetical protein
MLMKAHSASTRDCWLGERGMVWAEVWRENRKSAIRNEVFIIERYAF